jgi:hypothetical protein
MPEVKRPMQGVRIWENDKNHFTVFELHYSADEEKRSVEWKDAAKSGMPRRKFQQEYELEWVTYQGMPVYGDWNKKIHASAFTLEPQLGLPLLIGWDFGLCAAALVGQYVEGTLNILKEFTSVNMGCERFSTYVVHELKQIFPQWNDRRRDWLCFIDPSGNFRKDTNEDSCASILNSKGFLPIPGPVNWEPRRGAVDSFLCRMYRGNPGFQVNINECPVLTKGFDGGYRYPEKAAEIEQTSQSPIKNIYSHIHDALQYLAWGVNANCQNYRSVRVPRPAFGFIKP